jgi:hypothetical protein
MKRLTCVLLILLGLTVVAKSQLIAGSDDRSVTAAGRGTFGAGALLGAVALQGVDIGTGVFIEAGGSASGTFHAVLLGSSLGLARTITVDGNATEGSIGADGRATFSGTGSLNLGDGSLPLSGVAFRVIAGADGIVLSIDSTTLPAAALTAGAVTIE